MFPFVYSPTFKYPLSGNVIQDIAPVVSFEYEGLPEVEYEVHSTVASPGNQLGKLCDAVLKLAKEAGLDPETVQEIADIAEIAEGVKAAKVRASDKAQARADATVARAEKLQGLGEP